MQNSTTDILAPSILLPCSTRNRPLSTGIHVTSEEIPCDGGFFDVIISNGVIHLSPRKLALFREMYRVSKPGGKLQFANIVSGKELPGGMTGSQEAWSQ
jgi:arsenite methyltransferase